MQKTCRQCQIDFEITSDDLNFYEKVSPVFGGKKYLIPSPTLCSDCRQRRRLAWRNERTLYTRKCDATGKEIISVFSPNKKFKVYENDYWYSDKWGGKDYGRDFDFNRPFFDQFRELLAVVPQLSRSAVNNLNSDYTNQVGWCKNCYLIFEADYNENCFYSNNIYDSKSSMDSLHLTGSELCYECTDCNNCYNLKFAQDCKNCFDSWFLKNCIGCSNCFGCVNLRNKQYYFFNQKYTKEEYAAKLAEYNFRRFTQIQELRQKFVEFSRKFPEKSMHGVQNENSTGDYLNNTKNCSRCFDLYNAQDCKYVYNSRNTRNVYDMTVFGSSRGADFCYENHEIGEGVRNILFSDQVFIGCNNIMYSKLCINGSNNLFGCIGLKHASYCILNKQYTKEEYEKLAGKIIEHMEKTASPRGERAGERGSGSASPSDAELKNKEWGEFFPASLSPFGYNETIAINYYPLSKKEAVKSGFNWSDFEQAKPQSKKIIAAKSLSNDIKGINDDILDYAIECEITGRPFKIIRQELEFYRKHQLPLPRRHPDQRHLARMAMRNPRKLYDRNCVKCKAAIKTTYASDRPEIVYCDKCYLEAVY